MIKINEKFIKRKQCKKFYAIRCDALDIVSFAKTKEVAEKTFNDELKYISDTLNSLTNEQLTEYNKKRKLAFDEIFKEK